jgi:hypothetical protein
MKKKSFYFIYIYIYIYIYSLICRSPHMAIYITALRKCQYYQNKNINIKRETCFIYIYILYIPLHEELVSSLSMSLRSKRLSSTARTCGFSSPADAEEEEEEEEEAILKALTPKQNYPNSHKTFEEEKQQK